jgi:hypothetical protein
LRSGLNALQIYCAAGPAALASTAPAAPPLARGRAPRQRSRAGAPLTAAAAAAAAAAGNFGRDQSLAIFSLLGRILHNKRAAVDSASNPAAAAAAAAAHGGPEEDAGGGTGGAGGAVAAVGRGGLGFDPEEALARSGLGGELVARYAVCVRVCVRACVLVRACACVCKLARVGAWARVPTRRELLARWP